MTKDSSSWVAHAREATKLKPPLAMAIMPKGKKRPASVDVVAPLSPAPPPPMAHAIRAYICYSFFKPPMQKSAVRLARFAQASLAEARGAPGAVRVFTRPPFVSCICVRFPWKDFLKDGRQPQQRTRNSKRNLSRNLTFLWYIRLFLKGERVKVWC